MTARAGLDSNYIIGTAAFIADRDGLDDMTMASLAAELGVKTPSLYNHVDSLSDIKRRMGILGIKELSSRLAWAAIGKSGDDAVVAIIWAYRRFAEERPGLYNSTLKTSDGTDAEWAAALEEQMNILMKVVEPYGLENVEATHLTRAMRCMIHGYVSLRSAGSFNPGRADAEASFQYMVDQFLYLVKIQADRKEE